MEKVKYIPGDLVEFCGRIQRIENIDKQTPYRVSIKLEHGWFVNKPEEILNFLKPIPLTPAILEDNGWIYHYDVWAEKGFVVLSQNADSTWEVLYKMPKFGRPLGNTQVVDSKNPLCEIRYVHQLQRLLFGLGLNSELKV